ncbi:tail protein [Vibrio phage D479]
MLAKQSLSPAENYLVSRVHIRGVDKIADMTDTLVKLDIYETLDGLVSGMVALNDTIGVVDDLLMMGYEAIDIEFASGVGNTYERVFKKSFRLTNISRSQNGPSSQEFILITFANNMIVTNDLIKRPYVFKATSISAMIKAILDGMGDETPTYEIEDTLYQRDYVRHIAKPLDTIFDLKDHASSRDSDSCHFLFYEDRDSVKFKSLGTLRAQDYDFIIRKGASTGDEKFDGGDTNILTAIRISIPEQTNVEQMSSGMYGTRTISHSLIRKKLVTSDIKRTQYADTMGVMNAVPHMFTSPEALAPEMIETEQPLNVIQTMPADGFYLKSDTHTLGNVQGVGYMEDTYINAKKITVEIAGNTNLTVGNVVWMDYASIQSEGTASIMASGKWLIHDIRHSVDQMAKVFKTTIDLVNDSTPMNAVAGAQQ